MLAGPNIPILKIKKLRSRGVKPLAQGHVTATWPCGTQAQGVLSAFFFIPFSEPLPRSRCEDEGNCPEVHGKALSRERALRSCQALLFLLQLEIHVCVRNLRPHDTPGAMESGRARQHGPGPVGRHVLASL